MTQTAFSTDPQKGQWGGHSRRNGRELTGTVASEPRGPDDGFVRESAGSSWYRITLTVRSTDPTRPLTGTVRFHLHPTFNTPTVIPVEGGVARLELTAWGSFTVGAEADDGKTRLELDLALLDDAPAKFRLM